MTDIKIGLVSDLHAEFWSPAHFAGIGKKVRETLSDADVILLAGDIDNGAYSVRTARELFPAHPICLVAGNHEFYQRDYAVTLAALREEADALKVHFLNRDSYVTTIAEQQLRVLGVTLWTDFRHWWCGGTRIIRSIRPSARRDLSAVRPAMPRVSNRSRRVTLERSSCYRCNAARNFGAGKRSRTSMPKHWDLKPACIPIPPCLHMRYLNAPTTSPL